jgi:hypothetical protein
MLNKRTCVAWLGVILALPCGPLAAQVPSAGPMPPRRLAAGPSTQQAATTPTKQKTLAPDPKEWAVSLNGTWEFAPQDSEDFRPAKVPGFWGSTPQAQQAGPKAVLEWKTGTYRRDFQVPPGKTGAIIEFDMLRWGGEVLVNGRSAGTWDLGHSPASFNISSLIRPGTNRLEVRPRGWAALERYQGRDIQIPVGAGNWFGIKDGGIPDDVTLRLYNEAWIDALVLKPLAADFSCDVATRVGAGPAGWKGSIAAQILDDDGHGMSPVRHRRLDVPAGTTVDVELKNVMAKEVQVWRPESPAVYHMVVWLEGEDGASVAAVREDTFGFRDLKLVGGRLTVNSDMVPLFGATELVMYRMMELFDDPVRFKTVQVDLFKAMNGIAFRSHVNPLPRRWLDLCDRYGILVVPEFPNFPDVQRTSGESPYELPDYWKNLHREARGIVAARTNHPCIVGWSVSNEGSGFGDWERRFLVPFVKSIDPRRFVMLSGDVSEDVADQHNFAGMWWGTFAEFQRSAADLARFYPGRMLGCSEYGQYGPSKRWYGPRQVTGQSPEFQEDLARILMEQTEVLRRARFSLIMPYSYGGGWFGKTADQTGRPEDAAAPYHALRNALAPLGVSFESPRHAVAGTTVEIPVWLYSDSAYAYGRVEATLYLLDKHPGYDWNGSLDGLNVLASGGFDAQVDVGQAVRQNISLYLPAETRACYLAAIAKHLRSGRLLAISIKPLRLYEPPAKPANRLNVGVIDKDGRLTRWLRDRGHRIVMAYGDIKPDAIVISEGCLYDERIRTWGASMTSRLNSGVRLIILEQCNWDAKVMQSDISKPLSGLTAVPQQTSLENLFPHPALAEAVGTDVDFQRLNGLDNVAMRVALVPDEQVESAASRKAPARLTPEADKEQAAASQPSAWSSWIDGYGLRGEKPGWALATRSFGRGQVLACQVPLLGRIDRADASQFDPVAERLLIFLLEGRLPAPTPASAPASQPMAGTAQRQG